MGTGLKPILEFRASRYSRLPVARVRYSSSFYDLAVPIFSEYWTSRGMVPVGTENVLHSPVKSEKDFPNIGLLVELHRQLQGKNFGVTYKEVSFPQKESEPYYFELRQERITGFRIVNRMDGATTSVEYWPHLDPEDYYAQMLQFLKR